MTYTYIDLIHCTSQHSIRPQLGKGTSEVLPNVLLSLLCSPAARAAKSQACFGDPPRSRRTSRCLGIQQI